MNVGKVKLELSGDNPLFLTIRLQVSICNFGGIEGVVEFDLDAGLTLIPSHYADAIMDGEFTLHSSSESERILDIILFQDCGMFWTGPLSTRTPVTGTTSTWQCP